MHECPIAGACSYTGRMEAMRAWQNKLTRDMANFSTGVLSGANESNYMELQCATGYTGNLCAGCAKGYGLIWSGSCRKCPPVGLNTIFYILSYLLTLALLLITIRTQLGKGMRSARGSR